MYACMVCVLVCMWTSYACAHVSYTGCYVCACVWYNMESIPLVGARLCGTVNGPPMASYAGGRSCVDQWALIYTRTHTHTPRTRTRARTHARSGMRRAVEVFDGIGRSSQGQCTLTDLSERWRTRAHANTRTHLGSQRSTSNNSE